MVVERNVRAGRNRREKEWCAHRPCGGEGKSTFEDNVVQKNTSISHRGQTDAPTNRPALRFAAPDHGSLRPGGPSGPLLGLPARKLPTGQKLRR